MNPLFFLSRKESETKVANDRLLSYGLGLTGQNMTCSFVASRLFVYLNTILKIPAEKTGIITGVSTMWDAINDPLSVDLLTADATSLAINCVLSFCGHLPLSLLLYL